jgi:hypothetical protein
VKIDKRKSTYANDEKRTPQTLQFLSDLSLFKSGCFSTQKTCNYSKKIEICVVRADALLTLHFRTFKGALLIEFKWQNGQSWSAIVAEHLNRCE